MHPAFCALLMRIRPAQLGDVVKRLLRVQRVEMRLSGGGIVLVDPVSVIGLALLRQHEYEPTLTRAVSHLLAPGDIFVDVGANEGYFAVCAALRGAEVHAFEPQSRLRAIFEANMKRNGFANVQLHTLALSDAKGTARLYLRPSTNSGASSMIKHWRLGDEAEEVATMTFDSFASTLRGQIRMVKVDCEGAEDVIIPGAASTIADHRIDHLVVEYHPTIIGADRCAQIDRQIRDRGYQLTEIRGTCFYSLPERVADLAPLERNA